MNPMRLLLMLLTVSWCSLAGCAQRSAEASVTQAAPPGVPAVFPPDPIVLPAGTYRCRVTGSSQAVEQQVIIERTGDAVVAMPAKGARLNGFLFGTRLALVSTTVNEVGIAMVQVQATQQASGDFVGTIERFRDGVLLERHEVVLTH